MAFGRALDSEYLNFDANHRAADSLCGLSKTSFSSAFQTLSIPEITNFRIRRNGQFRRTKTRDSYHRPLQTPWPPVLRDRLKQIFYDSFFSQNLGHFLNKSTPSKDRLLGAIALERCE